MTYTSEYLHPHLIRASGGFMAVVPSGCIVLRHAHHHSRRVGVDEHTLIKGAALGRPSSVKSCCGPPWPFRDTLSTWP